VLGTVVMFAAWLATLLELGQRGAWGWFAAVFVTQVLFLGIVGILAYALLGRRREPLEVVTRPAIT
jgi:hypothetical protein